MTAAMCQRHRADIAPRLDLADPLIPDVAREVAEVLLGILRTIKVCTLWRRVEREYLMVDSDESSVLYALEPFEQRLARLIRVAQLIGIAHRAPVMRRGRSQHLHAAQ